MRKNQMTINILKPLEVNGQRVMRRIDIIALSGLPESNANSAINRMVASGALVINKDYLLVAPKSLGIAIGMPLVRVYTKLGFDKIAAKLKVISDTNVKIVHSYFAGKKSLQAFELPKPIRAKHDKDTEEPALMQALRDSKAVNYRAASATGSRIIKHAANGKMSPNAKRILSVISRNSSTLSAADIKDLADCALQLA